MHPNVHEISLEQTNGARTSGLSAAAVLHCLKGATLANDSNMRYSLRLQCSAISNFKSCVFFDGFGNEASDLRPLLIFLTSILIETAGHIKIQFDATNLKNMETDSRSVGLLTTAD